MMKKTLICVLFFCLTAFLMEAQEMSIRLKDGSDDRYKSNLIDYVDFSEKGNSGVHECVDLGLPSGLKWATCNIGANAPEEYGEYYAWAELETKHMYDQYHYSFFSLKQDDIFSHGYGEIEALGGDISETKYDVAHLLWGENWRLPTREEFSELTLYCSWFWTSINNVYGYEITGTNGNKIFLPATGLRIASAKFYKNNGGNYWSSTPLEYSNHLDEAYHLYFYRDDYSGNDIKTDSYFKYYGMTIRPVKR